MTTPEPIRLIGVATGGRRNPAPGDLTETKCDLCGTPVFSTHLNQLILEYTNIDS